MARQRKPAADRKAEIVQAAVRLAAGIGPDRVTARHLAEAVGLSQPAIFRHFATMPDVWLAVAETVAQRLGIQDPRDHDDPVEALSDMVARHLTYIRRTPAIPAILFSRELHAENEPMRRHFDEVMANRRARFADLVTEAQDLGRFRTDIDADDAGALILAAIQGLAVRWSLENRRFDLAEEGTRLIGQVIDGFRTRP